MESEQQLSATLQFRVVISILLCLSLSGKATFKFSQSSGLHRSSRTMKYLLSSKWALHLPMISDMCQVSNLDASKGILKCFFPRAAWISQGYSDELPQ